MIALYISPPPPFFFNRHHTYKKTDHKNIELTEVGPRFEMKCKYNPRTLGRNARPGLVTTVLSIGYVWDV